MFCNNCGNEIKDGIKFCPFCGAGVEAIKETTMTGNPADSQESSGNAAWQGQAQDTGAASSPWVQTSGSAGSSYTYQEQKETTQAPSYQPTGYQSSGYQPTGYQSGTTYQSTVVDNTEYGEKKPGIVSMILGILSLTFCYTTILTAVCGVLCLAASIVAIVLSSVSRNRKPNGFAKAGLICGIIGLVLTVIFFILALSTDMYSRNFYSYYY